MAGTPVRYYAYIIMNILQYLFPQVLCPVQSPLHTVGLTEDSLRFWASGLYKNTMRKQNTMRKLC